MSLKLIDSKPKTDIEPSDSQSTVHSAYMQCTAFGRDSDVHISEACL